MKLSGLFDRAGLVYPAEYADIEILNIVTDSRKVGKGSLFICIKGFHSDGHDFIGDVIKAGAAAVVAEEVRDECVGGAAAIIIVENTRRATSLLCNSWYRNPTEKLKIIAVTGTNGKTSVTYMLYDIFTSAMYKCGLVGTVNCYSAGRRLEVRGHDPLANLTTPDPEDLYRMFFEMVSDGVEYVFIEATSHALYLDKLEGIKFHTAVFTNLSQDHLDFHGDMEKYFAAKSKLFGMCRTAVINTDDPYGVRLADTVKCKKITCSVKDTDADYYACDTEYLGAAGSKYKLIGKNCLLNVKIPIAGVFSVINSIEAAAVAINEGISPAALSRALAAVGGIDGRMERVKLCLAADFSVFIDYAHTPDALEKLLKSAVSFRNKGQRIVLLFGCGGDRDRAKRKEVGIIASRIADFTVITSDNSRSEEPQDIIADILKGIDKESEYTVIPDRREAVIFAVRNAREGDIILLAGKGHEQYEITKTGRHPFNEKEIVTETVEKYHCRKNFKNHMN